MIKQRGCLGIYSGGGEVGALLQNNMVESKIRKEKYG